MMGAGERGVSAVSNQGWGKPEMRDKIFPTAQQFIEQGCVVWKCAQEGITACNMSCGKVVLCYSKRGCTLAVYLSIWFMR